MANFCAKCGSPLVDGACPNCDVQRPAPKFCNTCGSQIDPVSGVCERCAAATVSEPAAAYAPPVKKKRFNAECLVRKMTASKRVIVILLSIALFLCATISCALISVRNMTDEDSIYNAIEDVSLSDISEELAEDFCREVSDYLDHDISVRTMDDIIDGIEAKEFAAECASELFEDILSGENEFKLRRSDISRLLSRGNDVFEDEIGSELTDDQIDTLSNWLLDNETISLLTAKGLEDEMPDTYSAVQTVLSYLVIGLAILLCAVCVGFMIKTSISGSFFGIGISLTVVSAIPCLAALVSALAPSLLKSIFGNAFVASLVNAVFTSSLLIYLPLLLVGIALIVARPILSRYIKKTEM